MKTAMRFFVAAVGIFLLTPRCLLAKEVLIKSLGSSVHPCVPCGLRFLPTLNQSFPKDNINEGKAWLAAKTEPAEINVDGTWDSSEWGMMLLHQAKNAREVTGTSDNWEIEGVVSGKKVFLVFSSKGRLVYTTEASQKEDGSLSGSYIKGIMRSDSGNKAMLLRKTADAQTSQPADAGNAPTHVVVYRKHYHNCPQVKAPVYVDGKEVADLQNGRYLTLNLSPGKHMIGTTKIGRMGSQAEYFDVAPGTTYYVNFEFPSAWVCTIDIQKADASEATEAIAKLKPNDAKRVKIPEMVSLDPIGK